MSVAVKVCGIRTPADAELAVRSGASAVGMVFWPRSPRVVSMEQAATIAARVPGGVRRVGVFVNASPVEVAAAVRAAGLDLVQLHGDEAVDAYRDVGAPLVKAVTLDSDSAVDEAAALPADVLVLVEAAAGAARGGSGRQADWQRAATLSGRRPIWLAGGLSADNVVEAIARVRPQLVDVASGVESSPGVKDPARVRAFLEAVKGAGA